MKYSVMSLSPFYLQYNLMSLCSFIGIGKIELSICMRGVPKSPSITVSPFVSSSVYFIKLGPLTVSVYAFIFMIFS